MKKIKYSLLSGAILFFSAGIAQVKKLDAAQITIKSSAIKKMIERHNNIVTGLSALAVVQQVLFFTPMFLANFNKLFDRPVCDCGSKSVEKLHHLPVFSALANGMKDLFCTSSGWQYLLTFCAGEAATHFILQKVDTAFHHPDTLRWYIYAHVPYVRAINTIKNVTIELQASDLDAQARDHYYALLYAYCDRLSGYGEDMCAYMVYKSSELEGRTAEMAERMADYLLNYHNKALGAIGDELDKQTPDYQKVNQLITLYESEIRSYRDMFAVIEGELKQR